MRKTFSAHISAVDLKIIDKNIDEFICENGYEPYIFMNRSTILNIFDNATPDLTQMHVSNFGSNVASYKGYKVHCNNDLNFGEVELR